MADSLISRPETKPDINPPSKDSAAGNSLSAKIAPELSSGKSTDKSDNSTASCEKDHPAHHMSPAAKAVMERKMSEFGKKRQTLGSYETIHYGYTDRPPVFDKEHNLKAPWFKAGINPEGRTYFYKEVVRVPVTDEMAVYKDNADKMGWKFSDKDIKKPEIVSMTLLTDLEPKSLSDGKKAFIGEFLIKRFNQSGKHEIGFVTPGFNMKFKDMDAMAVLTERDTGVLCVTDAWGSLQKILRYPADQDGIEIHYDRVDKPLWMGFLQSGILTPDKIDLFSFSKGTWADTEFLFTHAAVRTGTELNGYAAATTVPLASAGRATIPLLNSVNFVEANQPSLRIQPRLGELAASAKSVTFWVSNPHKPKHDNALKLAKFVDKYDQVGAAGPELLKDLPPSVTNVRVIERNVLNSRGPFAIDHDYPSRALGYDFRHPDAERGLGLVVKKDPNEPRYHILEKDQKAPKDCRVYGKNPRTRGCSEVLETEEGNAEKKNVTTPQGFDQQVIPSDTNKGK